MVKDYVAPVRVYEYPFELVMKAYERRFPTTPHLPSFAGSEILNEYTSEDGSISITERRCKVSVTLPYLLKKIAGVDHFFFIQTNTLDHAKRVLKIEARNESFSGKVAVKELCYYKVHPENADWTVFEQKAELEMLNFFGFESMIEKFGLKTYSTQIKKAKEVLPIFIEELKNEGITHVPIFEKASENETVVPPVTTLNKSIITDVSSECNSDDFNSSATMTESFNSMDVGDNILDMSSENLSLLEQNCLINMKRKWEKKQNCETYIDDLDLLRFLRGTKLNEQRTHERLLNYVKWRSTNNIDRLPHTWSLSSNLQPYFLGGWHHHDNEGRPLYIIKLGQIDLKGLLKCIGCNSFIKQALCLFEEALRKIRAIKVKSSEANCRNITCIVDLDGLTMRHAWRPITRTLLKLIEICERYYPETLGKMIITNTPKFFTLLWPLVQAIIADETKKKFFIYPKNITSLEILKNHIPEEFIPKFLGGNADLPFADPPTPLIPKSLYLEYYADENNQHFENCLMEYNYKAISITKLHTHHISIPIDEVDNIISWDFDVLDGSTYYRITYSSQTNTIADRKSFYDISDHSVRVYNEGSSVRGSLVCDKVGVYNLVWEYSESDTVAKPKTRIIYYYEVIPPQKFRSSLHSISSSLSDLSQMDAFDCRYSQYIDHTKE